MHAVEDGVQGPALKAGEVRADLEAGVRGKAVEVVEAEIDSAPDGLEADSGLAVLELFARLVIPDRSGEVKEFVSKHDRIGHLGQAVADKSPRPARVGGDFIGLKIPRNPDGLDKGFFERAKFADVVNRPRHPQRNADIFPGLPVGVPAQIERIDNVQRPKIIGLSPHDLLATQPQGERRQHHIDKGFTEFVLKLPVEPLILAERLAIRVANIVDRVVHPAADQGQRGLFQRAGRETTKCLALTQKIILALQLGRIALHDEFRIPKHGGAQDVLGFDKPFEFNVVGDGNNAPRRGRQHGQTEEEGTRDETDTQTHGIRFRGV